MIVEFEFKRNNEECTDLNDEIEELLEYLGALFLGELVGGTNQMMAQSCRQLGMIVDMDGEDDER